MSVHTYEYSIYVPGTVKGMPYNKASPIQEGYVYDIVWVGEWRNTFNLENSYV